MDLLEVQPAEVDAVEPLEAEGRPSMEHISDSIWRLIEEVLLLLRAEATNQVRRQKRPDVLWLDDLTRAQANTVIAVRQLSETYPEGVTLRKLAETTGVSLAYADEVRRALGSPDGQREIEAWWRPAARARGYVGEVAERIWAVLKAFASFGFCKAHAAAWS